MAPATKNDGTPSFGDPYEILNLEFGATDEEISKSYRRLALKYHPDKQRQQQKNNSLTAEEIQSKFHSLTEAKAFLLDAEHKDARQKYDAKRRSEISRKKEEFLREQNMSARRKRMRDELLAKEKSVSKGGEGGRSGSSKANEGISNFSRSSFMNNNYQSNTEKERIEKLRREGNKMRERYQTRVDEKEASIQKEMAGRKASLQERRIRLKWSRSRISISHSEESIALLLKQFGEVESVEFIGAKGNAALVTFVNASSCSPCVEAYLESDEMRATFVGQRKNNELKSVPTKSHSLQRSHDFEDLDERKIRQAAEREALLREMERDDMGLSSSTEKEKKRVGLNQKASTLEETEQKLQQEGRIYPLKFPIDDRDIGLSPMQRLEKFEKMLLPLCVLSNSMGNS